MTKICEGCHMEKTLDNYYLRYDYGDKPRYHNRCKSCQREIQMAYSRSERGKETAARNRAKQSEALKLKRALSRYGVTPDHYEQLLAAQDGRCGICNGTETYDRNRFCIDHDHKTGQVRGLLCNRCNKALGGFKDDISTLVYATEYLQHWSALQGAKAERNSPDA